MRNLLLTGLFFLLLTESFSQAAGDYRSRATGGWDVLTTWERFDGSSWNIPTALEGVPSSLSGEITIRNTHTVSTNSDISVDQLIINTGGALSVNLGHVVTIANGAGVDISVSGSLVVQGELILQNGATHSGTSFTNTLFLPGSKYRHQYTTAEGSIPTANWLAGSETIIEGYTTAFTATAGGNWSQNFADITWNCTSQGGVISLAGLLISADNLTVLSTGNSVLRLSTIENPTVTIDGNLTIEGTARLHLSTTGASTTVDVGGDFIFSSTNATGDRSIFTTTGATTVNVAGDFLMNAPGGQLRMASGANGAGTLSIAGNFELIAGTLTEAGSSAVGNIIFTGTNATHMFNNLGAITNSINYVIPVTNTLIALDESPIQGGANSSITVNGTLVVQSENSTGAIINGTGSGGGNVRVTNANRFYNPGAVVMYAGNGPQVMGSGQPLAPGVTTIINNVNGVAVGVNNLNVQGNLTMQSGDLTISNFNFSLGGNALLSGGDINFNTAGTGRTLTFGSLLNLSGGNVNITSGAGNANLIINGSLAGSNAMTFAGDNCNVTINGTGSLGIDFPLPAPTTLKNLTINRSGAVVIVNEELTVTAAITITNGALRMNNSLTAFDINLATGTTVFFEGQTLELQRRFNSTQTGGVLSVDVGSTLNVFGAGNMVGPLAFSPSGNTLGTFHMNRTGTGTLATINSASPVTVENVFTLERGTLLNDGGLSFGIDAVVTRYNTASFAGTSTVPGGGPYNLFYEGVPTPNTITTGVEALGALRNLTSNFTGNVTVAAGSTVAIEEALTINAGVFNCGPNSISANTLTNESTLNAQGSTVTLTGDFTNNGPFNRGTGTFVFDGISAILGSENPAFRNIVIDGVLEPPAPPIPLNIHGSFTNNGTFDNQGIGTVAFLGTAGIPQVVSGSTVTNFNNITVSNTSASPDVTIESSQNLTGVLTLAASATFDADGSAGNAVFTLISTNDDTTEDAAIGIFPNAAAQVLGNVTVQRYMSLEGDSELGDFRIYRYISSPVQNGTVADIQNEIPVTGRFSGASTCTGCLRNPSLYYYNESVLGAMNSGYIAFPAASGSNSEQFVPGRGYAIFVRGDIDPILSAGSARWDLRGPVNRDNINYNVTFTSSGSPSDDGWNLIGNPYPSTIDWDAPNGSGGWLQRNRVAATIYMLDNSTTPGQWATYTLGSGGTGVNGGSNLIAMGQAFWVQTTPTGPGSPNLISTENVKTPGQQTSFIRQRAPQNILRLALNDGRMRDETLIHFRDDATDEFDYHADAWKLPNVTINLSSIAEGVGKLAVNAMKDLQCARTVRLDVSGVAPGAYTMEFSQTESFRQPVPIILIDNFAGEEIDVRSAASYSFEVSADSSSFGSERFAIRFGEGSVRADFLVKSPPAICAAEHTEIEVDKSQDGVQYQLYAGAVPLSEQVTGSGSLIRLAIPAGALTDGATTLSVRAGSGDCFVHRSFTVNVSGGSIPQIAGAERCGPGKLTLAVNGVAQGQSAAWYDSPEAVEPIARGPEFDTPELSESRMYYVETTASEGCVSQRVPVLASVRHNEPVEISQDFNVLRSSYTEGNQWYLDDRKIEGATGQDFEPSQSGNYRVVVSSGTCQASATYEYILMKVSPESPVMVYPNPVSSVETLYVEFAAGSVGPVQVISATGAAVMELTPQSPAPGLWRAEANTGLLGAGIYLVRFTADGKTGTVKFVRKP